MKSSVPAVDIVQILHSTFIRHILHVERQCELSKLSAVCIQMNNICSVYYNAEYELGQPIQNDQHIQPTLESKVRM